MLTALRKIYDFAGNWQGVLKKSVAFSLLHSIFDMFHVVVLVSYSLSFIDFGCKDNENPTKNKC